MSDRAALLAAIRQFPDDDTPRLVFADWLDEHGESERAEFIRRGVEHERARLANPLVGGRLEVGIVRFAEPGPSDPWSYIHDPNRWRLTWCQYDRGFLFEIECAAADWLAHADAILAEHPVRRVRLTDRTAGDPPCVIGTAGVLTKAVLTAKWPGIEFELQPPTSFQSFMQANFPPILPAGPITLTGTTS